MDQCTPSSTSPVWGWEASRQCPRVTPTACRGALMSDASASQWSQGLVQKWVWKWYPQMAFFFYIMEKQFPKKICDKRWITIFSIKAKVWEHVTFDAPVFVEGKPLVSCKWSLKLIHGVNFNAPSGSIAEMVVILPCRLLLRVVVVVVVLVVVVVVVVVVVIVGTVVTASTVKTYLFLKVCYSAHGTPKKREQLYISPSFSI